jgi:hypothetical protein
MMKPKSCKTKEDLLPSEKRYGTWLRKVVTMSEKPYKNPNTLRKMYHGKGMSTYEIGDEFGVSDNTILRHMREYGIERRDKHKASHMRIQKKPASYYTSSDGYCVCSSTYYGNKSIVYVHQLVAIANGADPYKVFSDGEYHTHHKNEVRWDNRPENLKFVSQFEHRAEHRIKDINRRDPGESNPMIQCACGCGEKRPKYDEWGVRRKYIFGHHNQVGET